MTVTKAYAKIIAFECDGVLVQLTRWTEAMAYCATHRIRFTSPQVMFEWLDQQLPNWREHRLNQWRHLDRSISWLP
jgi:hypothetical protein